jgi:hypothetical protein
MLRKLLCRLLGAELAPAVSWSEIDSLEVLARVEARHPRLFGGSETVQQVLCRTRDGYALFKCWGNSRRLDRITFGEALDARQMRIAEMQPAPSAQYRFHLWPADGRCDFSGAQRTWFGLWVNAPVIDFGAMFAFMESPDRQALKDLRHKLLGGQVPESLQNEEAMWERINSLPEAERRGAMAAMAMQSFAAMERQFHQEYPDAGPVPADLQPAFNAIQQRVQEINRTAAAAPPDAELAEQMQRFVADVRRQAPPRRTDDAGK